MDGDTIRAIRDVLFNDTPSFVSQLRCKHVEAVYVKPAIDNDGTCSLCGKKHHSKSAGVRLILHKLTKKLRRFAPVHELPEVVQLPGGSEARFSVESSTPAVKVTVAKPQSMLPPPPGDGS